ncbi:hypothetical protein IM792_15785 [Mucilaginibacter sp. JRF]|uniref:DUF3846 domain-containing protein n=1 Tax=Mucilaginibacter sp. JRF TaxID=2780088 RepID=UPI00187F9817|nr:hypothetical protein [Mucilaginibacter sp. JRF]MBE9585918.1 hypothetical protein [Mucilaginibacter sp. JRF]
MHLPKVITGILIDSTKKEINVIQVENTLRAICPLLDCKKIIELKLDGNTLCLDEQGLLDQSLDKKHFRFFEIQFKGNGLVLGKIKNGEFTNVSKSVAWVSERVTFL